MALNGVQVAAAAYIGGFTGDNIVQAVQLAYALSEWDPAKSGNDHYGLWQIKKSAHPNLFTQYQWNNPADNARMANVLFQSAGGLLHPEGSWSAWSGAYDQAKYNAAKPGAQRDYDELKKELKARKSPESILGASRTDGSKSAEGGVGAQVVNAVTNPLSPLFQANLWMRVGQVALGLILIAVGVAKMTNAVPIATRIAKAVA